MSVKLLTEQQLVFLSLKESYKSALVKMPHLWKSQCRLSLNQPDDETLVLIAFESRGSICLGYKNLS